MKFAEFCKQLEIKIQNSYEEGVALDQAEKLAAEFLYAQLVVSGELKNKDLDARMKKSGLKAIRAAVYSDACSKADKKPTENALENIINTDSSVSSAQDDLDLAEVNRDELLRYYNIFREAHIYYRGVSKGKFD